LLAAAQKDNLPVDEVFALAEQYLAWLNKENQ
jgi:hypothetical protein